MDTDVFKFGAFYLGTKTRTSKRGNDYRVINLVIDGEACSMVDMEGITINAARMDDVICTAKLTVGYQGRVEVVLVRIDTVS